jgi:cytoskeletal protein RodZ
MNHIGEYLKQLRTEKNISMEEVAEHTGIREQYLQALESGDFNKIPGEVFIKGFIRNYGNYLGADGNELVEAYTKGLGSPEELRDNAEEKVSDTIVVKNPDTGEEKSTDKTMIVTPAMMEEASAAHRDQEAHRDSQEETDQPDITPFVKEIDDDELEEYADKESGTKHSLLQKIKDFIDENLYEEVDDDEDEEEEENQDRFPGYAYQKEEDSPSRKGISAYLNMRVFYIVFAACFGIFCIVMAYFIFGGKTMPELSATTSLTDSVKSDHSTARKAESDEEKPKETKKEEKKETNKGNSKSFGQETKNGVTVVVTYKKPVWTEASLDGKSVERITVPAGSTRTYRASKEVELSFGSIRDVSIKVNGKDYKLKDTEWGTMSKTFRAN